MPFCPCDGRWVSLGDLSAGLRYTTEAAFQAHMAAWRLDGKPRTARQFAVYNNCPLPTPEDRLFFILVSLKTYALQVVHGRLILIEAPPSIPEGML